MTKRTCIVVATAMASILCIGSFSAVAAKPDKIVEEITPYVVNDLSTPTEHYFLDDKTYAQLSEDRKTISTYDITSGKKIETVFDVANTRESQVANIDGFVFCKDRSKIIVWNDKQSIYRRSFKARYYVYDFHSKILRNISPDFKYTQCPMFSPDGRMIAFVHDNNIYLKKLDYNTQVAVTTDGKAGEIINGATDWTYEEEFYTTSLMTFTEDNTALCFVKSNETEVPTYTLPIYAGYCDRKDEYALYPGQFSYKYPVAGEKNSVVSLHVYEISNRKIKEIELPDKKIEYIPRIDAIPSNDILVTTLNREQNSMEIYSLNPKTTLSKSVFSEKSEAWIIPEAYEQMKIVSDGFVVLSARSGWTHAYKYSFNGSLTRTITQGDFDVTDFYGMDAAGNAFIQAASPSPIDRTVYRIDAKGVKTPLTAEKGFGSASFSGDCLYAVTSFSSIDTPPVYKLISTKGKEIRQLVDNSQNVSKFYNLAKKEFITVPGANGLSFNGYLIKPANFNSSQKYPVVVYQYSGPGSQTVLNKWSFGWEYYFASKGFVVFCIDGRGTGGRGANFMFSVYKNLGHYETIDQLAGATWLRNQSWVDASRIGIHGWSYGGYETLMCLQQDNTPFSAGVAIAPVTDWRLYDSIYTERYMLTPQQNYDGYNVSAPLNFTDKMHSDLLLMLGTADDNVHPANSYEYAASLQFNGTLFDMMVFPNKNHSIYGCNARAVVYGNMFRFFQNKFIK